MPEVLQFTNDATSAANANDEPDLSIFENKSGLADDLKFLASMPELCDVTFLVGETREPVCAVKVIFCSLLLVNCRKFSCSFLFLNRLYWQHAHVYSRKCCTQHPVLKPSTARRKMHRHVKTNCVCF